MKKVALEIVLDKKAVEVFKPLMGEGHPSFLDIDKFSSDELYRECFETENKAYTEASHKAETLGKMALQSLFRGMPKGTQSVVIKIQSECETDG